MSEFEAEVAKAEKELEQSLGKIVTDKGGEKKNDNNPNETATQFHQMVE